jgi:hypothetical protein
LERGLASGTLSTLRAAVERGEVDPYAAVLRVLGDEEFTAALLTQLRREE